jgi:hypothetical protein
MLFDFRTIDCLILEQKVCYTLAVASHLSALSFVTVSPFCQDEQAHYVYPNPSAWVQGL